MVAFEFYKDTYHGGSISETEWATFESRASEQLARYKRVYSVTVPDGSEDAESMAVCAMADAVAYFTAAANGNGQVTSASIGSVSTGYSASSGVDISEKGQAKELYRCASLYLDIYRGGGVC